MSAVLHERSGYTLTGAIDGVNDTFTTSYDYAALTVQVYVSGVLRNPLDANGYTLTLPNQIVFKIAPLPGPPCADTVEVEYQAASGVVTGGGAEGGCPLAPETEVLAPFLDAAAELVPSTEPKPLDAASVGAEDLVPTLVSDELVPALIGSD